MSPRSEWTVKPSSAQKIRPLSRARTSGRPHDRRLEQTMDASAACPQLMNKNIFDGHPLFRTIRIRLGRFRSGPSAVTKYRRASRTGVSRGTSEPLGRVVSPHESPTPGANHPSESATHVHSVLWDSNWTTGIGIHEQFIWSGVRTVASSDRFGSANQRSRGRCCGLENSALNSSQLGG